jgi:LuxR family maltose regulon positive regulatory protein
MERSRRISRTVCGRLRAVEFGGHAMQRRPAVHGEIHHGPVPRSAPEQYEGGLLLGKLVPPELAQATVLRSRLLTALTGAVQRAPLTLLSGPAGSGKTTLAASWWNTRLEDAPVAWFTLDEYDDDPGTFWTYVVEALARVGFDVADLEQPVSGGSLPTSFINRLASVVLADGRTTVLVIDNADQLTNRVITGALDLLLRNAGRRLRLVLCARADPQLPLHQHRLAGTLSEIRCDQLAFTADETQDLFRSLGIAVSSEVAQALCAETEGWAVGLRLAAAPLKRGVAPQELVTSLVQDDGSVAQYLFAEVLRDQPASVRRFLLRISVTAELWPDLVERLGAGRNSRRILAGLAHANAFVEQSSGAPGGYRIHPLFREMLQAQLTYEHPHEVAGLHRICAGWYTEAGRGPAAVAHAVAAEDWLLATTLLVEDLLVGRLLAHEPDPALRGLTALPADLADPKAAVIRAAMALSCGRAPAVADLVLAAEVAADASNGLALRASAAVVSVAASAAGGTATEVAAPPSVAAEELVAGLPDERRTERREMTAALTAARSLIALGSDAPTAALLADLGAAAAAGSSVGSRRLRLRPLAYLALLQALDGRPAHAERLASDTEAEWAGAGRPEADHSPAAAAALAWAHLDRYELEDARDWANRARDQTTAPDEAFVAPLVAVLHSRLLRLRHEYDKAEATLQAHLRAGRSPRWVEEQVVGEAVRTRLARGSVDEGLTLLDEHEHEHEPEHGTGWTARLRATAALMRGSVVPVSLDADGPAEGSLVGAVEAGTLRACRYLDLGAVPHAVAELSRALELAAPETLRWPFLDAPPQARRLLRTHAELRAPAAWLSPSFTAPAARTSLDRGDLQPQVADEAMVIQDLSERETEVLAHLSEMLSTAEIAATMFISVNTVRTHIRSILRKLSATRRNQAVRRARELKII